MAFSRGARGLHRAAMLGGLLLVFLSLILLVGLALQRAPAQASITTLTVTTTGDDAVPAACSGTSCATLRDAVAAANAMTSSSGSPIEIDLPAGTIALTNGVIDLGSTTDMFLTIKGHGPTPADSVVNQATPGSGVFETPIVNNLTTNFQTLTISGGHAGGFGGGALQTGSTGDVATFTHCVLSNNTATFGGAVLMFGGNLAISGSTFVSNSSTSGAGGAVDFVASSAPGNLTINTSAFTGNAATAGTGTMARGGAVSVKGPLASLAITGSTFDSNAAGSSAGGQGQGGALATSGETSGSITLSGFTNNTARNGSATLVPPVNLDNRGIGGAIFNDSGSLSVSDSRFAGNAATEGPAIEQDTNAGSVTANDNWWGSNAAPTTVTPAAVSANSARTLITRGAVPATASRLQLRAGAAPASIAPGGSAIVTADLYGRAGTFTTPLPPGALNGLAPFPAPGGTVFSNAVHGSLSGAATQFVNGKASATFTAGTFLGPGGADATADSQTATAAVTVTADAVVTLGSSSNPSVLGQPVTFTATIASGVALTTPSGAVGGTVQFQVDGANVGDPVPVAAGAASSPPVATMGLGTHSVAAAYSGDANFNAATGTLPGGQVVNKASASVAVGSSSNPSAAGQTVTFSATVTALAPGAGSPTGNVQFKDNGAAIGGPQALNGSGVASVTASSLSVGTHAITAEYGGSDGFLPATGSLVPGQVVSRAPTTLSIVSSTNPSVTGQGVTFTATPASSLPGTITGNVQFAVDGVARGAPVPLSGGSASLDGISDLTVGSHRVTATFGGDPTYAGSDATLDGGQVVGKAGTAATIGSSPNPSAASVPVGFTATVTATPPGAGTPTGQVQFSADGAAMGGPVALTGGVATLSGITTLSMGTHAVTATYLGDAGFTGSTSAPLTQVIQGYPTTVTVASANDPSVVGQPVSFTATVGAGTRGTPVGTVQFGIDGNNIGGPVVLSVGSAPSIAVDDLGVGPHTVTATYGGSANFAPSAGALPGGQTVARADTAVGVVSSHSPSLFGQPVTFTATVTAAPPGAGSPSGQVQFSVDGVDVGSPVSLSGGSAVSAPIAILSPGTHAVTANYIGDASFNPSTGSLIGNQVVTQDGTATTVGSSVNPSVVGQSVVFSATVAAVGPGAGTPSGMVSFFVDGVHLGDAPLVGGVATAAGVSSLAIGSHSVTATYAGDANFLRGTSAALTQTVTPAATSVSVASALTPSVYGQAVTFIATVAVVPPGSGQPAGTVAFSADGTAFGTASLVGTSAVSPPIATLAAGSHTVTATYLGAGNFAASTGSTTQVVSPAGTSLAVSSGPNPSVFGQTVTVSARLSTMAPGSGTPAGTVQFLDGSTPIGSVALSGGTASLDDAALAPGTHTISASFLGTTNFLAASGTASQTVFKADTLLGVSSWHDPSVFGQPVTFTATVSVLGLGSGQPTGVVEFFANGLSIGNGSLAGSVATSPPIAILGPGTHNIAATYVGDADFNPSTGSLSGGQVVDQAPVVVTVRSSVNPSVVGQSVVFSATVGPMAPGAGAPSGMVSFLVDGAHLGDAPLVSGVATASGVSSLAIGSHPVTAIYGGDANFLAGTSTALTQTVTPPATSLSLASAHTPSVYGQPVTFIATVAPVPPGSGQPAGTVSFYADGTSFGNASLFGTSAVSPPIATLGAGSHTVTATYLGSSDFAASTGSTTQMVSPAGTSLALSSGPSPSVFGQTTTFSAALTTVAPGSGTPTGNVQFLDGTSPIGTPVALAGGTASLDDAALAPGLHTISANFLGSANFLPAGGAAAQTVNLAPTTATVGSSQNPAAFDQSVTFTATVAPVAPGAGVPTGEVQFYLDGSTFGGPVTLSGGSASSSATSLSPGPHPVTVTYTGDTDFAATVSPPLVQTIGQIDATLNLTSTVISSVFSQPVSFSVRVTGTAETPTGVVQFGVDGINLGSLVPLAGGVATSAATSTLPVGVHTVTATYGGSISYRPTSAALPLAVSKADATATLASSANPSIFGQAIQFTATVGAVAPAAGTPGGQVQFLIDGTNFGGPAAVVGGLATSPSTGALDVGSHTIQFLYLGDAGFNPTSGSLVGSQVVNRSDTTTSVTTSRSPSAFGEAVQFTAQVTAAGGGAATPDGSVQFVVDGVNTGTPVTLSGGSATSQPIGSLAIGAHTVAADYAGSGHFNASSGSLAGEQVVQKATTTTTVKASENPAMVGDTVVFTATVDPSAATPTGLVQFSIDGSPAGSPLTLTGGVASFATSSLGLGSHSIVASYQGDSGFGPSSGALPGGLTVVVPATADLSVAQTGPAAVVPGGIATYVIVATNNGPIDATSVVLTESLPPGWLAVGMLPTQGICSPGAAQVTCQFGNLPAGAQAVVTLLLTPHGIGAFTLTATLSGNQPDPNLANNSSSVTTQVQQLGYWLFASDGSIFTFGDARFFGSTGSMELNRPVVAMRPTPTRRGYWLFARDGGVFSFGDAGFFGSTGSMRLNAPIVAMAATPDGKGYWLFGGDGGVFAFGDAGFFGSTGGQRLAAPIVGMAATRDAKGYWLVGSDGSVYGFGDAGSFGSLAGQRIASPIVGMAATPDGNGYWLVSANGSVSGFGDAKAFGSLAGSRLNAPVVAIASTPGGRGYWLVASDGGVFGFGDAPFFGSMGGKHLNRRIVGLAAGE